MVAPIVALYPILPCARWRGQRWGATVREVPLCADSMHRRPSLEPSQNCDPEPCNPNSDPTDHDPDTTPVALTAASRRLHGHVLQFLLYVGQNDQLHPVRP